MAKIPLRVYVKEVEQIIDQKQTEEAIAHCRHILHTYPKHLDTYRLLGKVYLESQRFGNAADIFQRVLSATPDDFISHVGMSIIREDENDLDTAIWHMERAFEAQPYNTAIQSELRRLFGRRDGMEPPKVHLTRGALARMYVKGNLYQQAIAELRAAIAENPQRYDLRVLLAQMYAQSDDPAKAIETCAGIVTKLPYCLAANRILAQLLSKTERAKEAEIYHKRLQELDPYEAYLGPNTPSADQVPAQAVMIEQLIWDGGPAAGAPSQPEWATSIGITLDDSNLLGEGVPDWMSEAESELPSLSSGIGGDTASDDNLIPEWMKEAGWAPSTGEFDENQSAFSFEDEEELPAEASEALAGDIPDWLQQIAPPGAIEQPDEIDDSAFEFPTAAASNEDIPDWLKEPNQVDTIDDSDLPDWLTPAAPIAAGVAAVAAFTSDSEEPETDEEIPDWLQELKGEAPSQAEEEILPDWLQEMSTDSAPEDEEIPDWLQKAVEEETPESITEPADEPGWLGEIIADEAEPTEIPVWLQEVVGEETLEPATEVEPPDMPDWLQEMDEDETPESITEPADEPDWLDEIIADEAEPTEIPVWLQDVVEEEALESFAETTSEPETGEIPDWLQEVVDEDTLEPLPESVVELEVAELPDWLQEVDEEEMPESVDQFESEQGAEEIPDWLQEVTEEALQPISEQASDEISSAQDEISPDAESVDSAMAWLESLAAEGFSEDELLSSPDESGEALSVSMQEVTDEENFDWIPETESESAVGEIPNWLQEVTEEEALGAVATNAVESEWELEAIPDWLQEVVEEETLESFAETEGELEVEETPNWLQEVAEEKTLEDVNEIEAQDKLEADEIDEIPDWLQAVAPIAAGAAVVASLASASDESEQDKEIPDWINEVADDEALELAAEQLDSEIPTVKDEDFPEMDNADAAMAWLDSLATDGFSEDELLSSSDESGETASIAIQERADGADFEPIAETDDELETEEIPDWLQEVVEEETLEPIDETLVELETEDIPDWLQEVVEEEHLEPVAAQVEGEPDAGEIPDWLQEVVEAEALESNIETLVEPETEDIPAWIKEDIEEEALELSAEQLDSEMLALQDDDFPDLDNADAAMAWLESLAAKQGVSEDELLSSPDEHSDAPPAWVQEVAADESSETAAEAASLPEWLQDMVAAETYEPSLETEEADTLMSTDPDADSERIEWVTYSDNANTEQEQPERTTEEIDSELPGWLQGIPQESLTDSSSQESTVDDEEIPVWLQDISQEIPTIAGETEVPARISSKSDIDDLPAWMQDIADEETQLAEEEPAEVPETPDLDDMDAAMAWLESLAAKQGVSEDELLSSPDERSEVPPAWVQQATSSTDATDIPTPAELEPEPIQEAPKIVSAAPEPPVEAPETPDLDDMDAAMAWLESLAAKQGVSEDELLSSPEERRDTPPSWVQDIQDEETFGIQESFTPGVDSVEIAEIEEWISEVPVPSEISAPTEDIAKASQVTATPAAPKPAQEFDISDADAAMAWLDNLASLDGISEDELLTRSDELTEAPLTQAAPAKVEEAASEDLREWIAKVPDVDEPETISTPAVEAHSPATTEPGAEADFNDVDAALAWLESLAAKQGVSEEELLTRPSDRRDTPPRWVHEATDAKPVPSSPESKAVAAPKITETPQISAPPSPKKEVTTPESESPLPAPPSWISDGHIPEDDFSMLPTDVSEVISAEAEELIDLNAASLIQLERLSGVGFRRAQAITAYRDEHGNFSNMDELYNVPGLDEDTIAFLKTRVAVIAPEKPSKPEPLPEVSIFAPLEGKPGGEWHQQQLGAREKLMVGNFDGAIEDYDALIKNGQHLDYVIEDLNKASEQFSSEVSLLRVLGDAYMQADRLQEALDAYTRAEELLQ